MDRRSVVVRPRAHSRARDHSDELGPQKGHRSGHESRAAKKPVASHWENLSVLFENPAVINELLLFNQRSLYNIETPVAGVYNALIKEVIH
jgi:hypothetical protein